MSQLHEPNYKKVYANVPEQSFADEARKLGWEVTKKGWPDFICTKGGKMVFVEVKPGRNHRLSIAQTRVMDFLAKAGIECYRWEPGKILPL
jgi:hypothetical protein